MNENNVPCAPLAGNATASVSRAVNKQAAFAFDFAAERKKMAFLADGIYPGVITQAYCMLDADGRPDHVLLTFDITSGAYAGVFSGIDSGNGDPSTAQHRGVRLNISEESKNGRAYAARVIEAIMDSNPGFDPSEALAEGGWGVLVGKAVTVDVKHHEFRGKKYNDFSFLNPADVKA